MQGLWEKLKPSLWGAVGGAIVLAIIGFNWGGWVTGGTAQETAEKLSQEAVVARLAPICVEQFNQESEKVQKLEELKEISSWKRKRLCGKTRLGHNAWRKGSRLQGCFKVCRIDCGTCSVDIRRSSPELISGYPMICV